MQFQQELFYKYDTSSHLLSTTNFSKFSSLIVTVSSTPTLVDKHIRNDND